MPTDEDRDLRIQRSLGSVNRSSRSFVVAATLTTAVLNSISGIMREIGREPAHHIDGCEVAGTACETEGAAWFAQSLPNQ